MMLRAPQAFLQALVDYARSDSRARAPGTLALYRATSNNPSDPAASYAGNVADLVFPESRSIGEPVDLSPAWLEIPSAWMRAMVTGARVHELSASMALRLTVEGVVDVHGALSSTFQALGFTGPYQPTVSGPVPAYTG